MARWMCMMEFHQIRYRHYLISEEYLSWTCSFFLSLSTWRTHFWICRRGQSCILQLVQFISLRIIPWVELLHVSLHHVFCRLPVTEMTFFLLVLPSIEMCTQVSMWALAILLQNDFLCFENLFVASTPLGTFYWTILLVGNLAAIGSEIYICWW